MHLLTLNTIVNICHSGIVVLNIWLKYNVDVIRSQMCWCPKNTHKESCAWKTQWSVCLKTHWKMCLKKHNELVLEKHRESCDWKTQSIMCLKITSFHVTIVNYVDEACIHWNRVKYIQFMFFYTPLYSLMVLIVWLENKSLGVKSDAGFFIQAFSKYCSLNLILCSNHTQRIFLFRISTLSVPVMKKGYINNLTPTAKGCIAPYMTPHVFQSQKNIYPCFSKCPPYICQ